MIRSFYYISLKLCITEQVIKINYTILYNLLDNYFFGPCHHNRAKPAYETVHHHMHAILEDGLRSSVIRLRLSFSVLDADCWRRRRNIGPVQYVGGREADEHPCAHCFPQPVVSETITNTSKQPYFTSIGRETDRECGYIRHSWLATRPADYLRCVTAELLHPDRASHRQRSVHTRRQGQCAPSIVLSLPFVRNDFI